MGAILSSMEVYLEAYSSFFMCSVLGGAHVGFVEAMEDHVARHMADKRMDEIRTDIKELQQWESTQAELSQLEGEATRLAREIQQARVSLNSTMDSNVRRLCENQLVNMQARFDSLVELIKAKNVSNTQYILAKRHAELLEHLANQPKVDVDPIGALATQRQTRQVFTRSKQSMIVINKLNQDTTGVSDILLSPERLSETGGHHHHHTVRQDLGGGGTAARRAAGLET